METLDKINQRMGQNTLRFGSSGITNEWQMRREYLTNRFTTNWGELKTI
jgi:DNA polymerase V